MIIAIDESGSPQEGSRDIVVFVAIHLRQRRTLLRLKHRAFSAWEADLPPRLKDARGEFKGRALDDHQLADFARRVLFPHPQVLVSPVLLRPIENPAAVVEKHRQVQVEGIRNGVEVYRGLDRAGMAQLYDEFFHWFGNLSYDKYLKVTMLGHCIHGSLVNAFGHAIVGGYSDELTRLCYRIDRDFVRQERSNAFWHEVLRNQVLHLSSQKPLPMLERWKGGHPVVAAYTRRDRFDLNRLFVDNLEFVKSHESFEVRVADFVATILRRNLNRGECHEAAAVVSECLAGRAQIPRLILDDFDADSWNYDPVVNPWLQHQEARKVRRER